MATTDARPFRSAGDGGQRGRPSSTSPPSRTARAIIAAKRYGRSMDLRREGGGANPYNEGQRRSAMSQGEVSAYRAAERREKEARDAVNLRPLNGSEADV
jgi:hypothetical protein